MSRLSSVVRIIGARAFLSVVVALASSVTLVAQELFWTAVNVYPNFAVRRSEFDGSRVRDISDDHDAGLGDIAVDEFAEQVYWIERGARGTKIYRSQLNGAQREVFFETEARFSEIEIDGRARPLYLGSVGIHRMDIDSGEMALIVDRNVGDVVIDEVNRSLYWVQPGESGVWGVNIWRADIDGSGASVIAQHDLDVSATGLAVHPGLGKLYWAAVDYRDGQQQVILRANLDGSDPEEVTRANSGLDDWPIFIDVDRANDQVYWVNGEDGEFFRVSAHGGQAERLFDDDGGFGPFGLAILQEVEEEPVRVEFLRGDVNDDARVELADAVMILDVLFLGAERFGCAASGDVNADGATELADAVYVLNFLFLGGRAVRAPFPECGRSESETDIVLGCEEARRACE